MWVPMSELVVTHNAGLGSCLSMRLHEVVKFRVREGRWPASVDSSEQFALYGSSPSERLDTRLIRELPPERPDFPCPVFDQNHQYGYYSDLDPLIYPVASYYCHPSNEVEEAAAQIATRMAGRTVVHYRGNDKVVERPRIAYQTVFDTARKVGGPYWVLTDEEEFRISFIALFPETDSLEFLPTIRRNYNTFVIGRPLERPLFAVRFLAALYAMRHAEKLVLTTGNTSLWAVLWRGSMDGVSQLR
jgi:hypothetical protein